MKKILLLLLFAFTVAVNGYTQPLPSGVIDDVNAPTLDSLDVQWQSSNGGDTLGFVFFEVRKVGLATIVWVSDTVFTDTTTSNTVLYTQAFDSVGLMGNTNHELRMGMGNSSGTIVYTSWFGFLTPLPPSAPIIDFAQSVNTDAFGSELKIAYKVYAPNANLTVHTGPTLGSYPNLVTSMVVTGIDTILIPIPSTPGTTVYGRVRINGFGIDQELFSFTTDTIVPPTITESDFLSVTSNSYKAYALGDFGSETSGTANCYRNGSLVNSSNLTDGDTTSYDFSGQTPGTTYQICWSFISSYGSDSVCSVVTTDTITPPPPTFPYTLASVHVGNGKVRFITTADTTTTLFYRVDEEAGCNATSNSIGLFSVPRGIDTFFVQLAGVDSLRIEAWLEDNMGDTIEYETQVIDLGPVVEDIILNLSLINSYFQNNTFTVDLAHNESTQVYNLAVELADNTYSVIANPNIIYQNFIEIGQTGMNVTIPADFGGATYMRVLAEPLSGLGPCGEGGGVSDWKLLPNTATGIRDISDFKTSVYPNPFTGSGTIESEEDGTLKVYNAIGQIVLLQDVSEGRNLLELEIEPGLYFYFITSKAGKKGTGNIIVQ